MGTLRSLPVVVLGLIAGPTSARAQTAVIWAGANDAPNALITGVWDGTSMAFHPEVPSVGESPGRRPQLLRGTGSRVRGTRPRECSMVAHTTSAPEASRSTRSTPSGVASHVPGRRSPSTASGRDRWARDGQGCTSRTGHGGGSGPTFRLGCGPPPAPVATPARDALSIDSLRDMDLTASGSHLCVSGTGSHTSGASPSNPERACRRPRPRTR